MFAFVWNIVTFIGCFVCVSYFLGLLGAVDLLVSASLLASVVKQVQFAPRTYAACDGAIDWRNGTDGRNYYLAAEWKLWEDYGPAESICRYMVKEWAIALSVG